MKKWMALGLLVLTFISQLGYYGIFAIEQRLVRYEQKKKLLNTLSNDELERIPWQASMRFMDDEREFSLHGEQYDIVRQVVEAGVRVYYAINDKNETRLLKKLAAAGGAHSQQQGSKKGILKVAKIYFSVHAITCLPPLPGNITMRPVVPHHLGIQFNREMTHPPDHA